MFDRGLAIVSFAFAIIFGIWGLAPNGWPKMPFWVAMAGFTICVFLCGLGVGLMVTPQGDDTKKNEPKIIDTNLFLQFSDLHTVPIERGQKNIKYWYALFTESIFVDTKDSEGKSLGGFSVPPRWSIFIIFDESPLFRQAIATCKGLINPKCDVQVANQHYAIITIVGDVTGATLDVNLIR
ncbi:MAG: hypothetical protein P4M15_13950 [Alphaproteobacteria bacterium]|nr:hypothetical protein [Alphaproteobacteria bacterium]